MSGMQQLQARCEQCRSCPLCEKRTTVVFGEGQADSGVVFIGEGPGEQEDLSGRPFVGPAGQLLDSMLELVGLSRNKNFYICNIVKCRPPSNRDPKPEEQNACMPWLEAQLEILKPKLIICLGRISAQRFIDEDFRITRQHGQWFERRGALVTAIYHPSALLRDPSRRPETFVDLKGIEAMVRKHCPGLLPAKPDYIYTENR